MPIVPCPAITSGSSYGCTNVRPRFFCSSMRVRVGVGVGVAVQHHLAPRAATASTLMRGVVTGITMTARQPRRCAASATPCA